MRAAFATVGSVLVHAAVLAIVTCDETAPEIVSARAPAPPAPPPTTAMAAPTEVELVVFTDADPTPGRAVAGTARVTGDRGRARGSGRGGPVGAAGDEPRGGAGSADQDKPARSALMTMRRPGAPSGVSGGFIGKFLEDSKPLAPPPDLPGERVGDAIAELRAQLRRAERYSPAELAALRAQLGALTEERTTEELRPAGGGTYRTEHETFRAQVNADGTVKLEDKPENLDAQDKLMRAHGIDPYGRAKLAYLDRTRAQRVAIGRRFREQELKKSVIYMQQHVARLWATTTDAAQRKQGLFELWDECAETGTPDEIAGGAAARAYVMAYIRAKVTYTRGELDALDRQRRSTQVFAP